MPHLIGYAQTRMTGSIQCSKQSLQTPQRQSKSKPMPTYKPFDLEAAKRGEKVQVHNPSYKPDVRILAWDAPGSKPIIVLLTSITGRPRVEFYTTTGKHPSEMLDLFMSPTPRKVWRVIYRDDNKNAAQRDFEDRYAAEKFYYQVTTIAVLAPFELEIPS